MRNVVTPREVEVEVTTYTCQRSVVMDTVQVCRRVPVAPAPAPACGVAACGGGASACAAPACDSGCDHGRGGVPARPLGKKRSGSDCGTGCAAPWPAPAPVCYTTVVENVQVPRTVTTMVPNKSKVKRTVYDCKQVEDTVMVNVMKCQPKTVKGVQVFCET